MDNAVKKIAIGNPSLSSALTKRKRNRISHRENFVFSKKV
jgi:hypothetical protein